MDTKISVDDCCTSPVAPLPTPLLIPTDRRNQFIAIFKALADSSRFDIYHLIAAQPEPICVCDIVDRFALSQPTISHHLKILREAGLIQVSRRGVWAYYEADAQGLELLRDGVATISPREVVRR